MRACLALILCSSGLLGACQAGLSGDLDAPPASFGLRNGSFEEPAANPQRPPGWGQRGSSYGRATVARAPGAAGEFAVKLEPGSAGSSESRSFMLYQVLDLARYRGQSVEFGARVASRGAGVNLVLWTPQGFGNDFETNVQRREFVQRRSTFEVPEAATLLTFGVQVLGPAGAEVWVDDAYVRLAAEAPQPTPSAPPSARPRAGQAGTAQPARVQIHASQVIRELPADFFGMHIEWPERGNGLLDLDSGSLRPEILDLLRPLRIPLFRFPGGIHADFYDWRLGVGPAGERGRSRNRFTGKSEVHHFGTPELLELLRATGAEACITTNYGTGKPEDAGAWARYLVEQHHAPRCWEVGNEIYLSGPHASGPNGREIYRPGEDYARDFPLYRAAIRASIPKARVGAILHLDTGLFPLADPANHDWSQRMLSALRTRAGFFALHNAYAPVILDDAFDLGEPEPRLRVYRSLFAGALQTRENLDAIAREITERSPLNRDTPFMITEFGTFFGLSSDPERHAAYVDQTRTLAAALYVASVLDVFIHEPRVIGTMYTNPIHRWYGSLITDTHEGLVTTPTYLLYRLYSQRFESNVVKVEVSSPRFDSHDVGLVSARTGIPTLLAHASVSSDGQRLTALLINRSIDSALETRIELIGFTGTDPDCQLLTADGLDSINGPSVSATVRAGQEIRLRDLPCGDLGHAGLRLPPGSIVSLVARGGR